MQKNICWFWLRKKCKHYDCPFKHTLINNINNELEREFQITIIFKSNNAEIYREYNNEEVYKMFKEKNYLELMIFFKYNCDIEFFIGSKIKDNENIETIIKQYIKKEIGYELMFNDKILKACDHNNKELYFIIIEDKNKILNNFENKESLNIHNMFFYKLYIDKKFSVKNPKSSDLRNLFKLCKRKDNIIQLFLIIGFMEFELNWDIEDIMSDVFEFIRRENTSYRLDSESNNAKIKSDFYLKMLNEDFVNYDETKYLNNIIKYYNDYIQRNKNRNIFEND